MNPSHFNDASLLWVLPFVFFLLCLAAGPVFMKEKWKNYENKIVFIVTGVIFTALYANFGNEYAFFSAKKMFFHHYVPFVCMMTALYVVSSGIHITTKGALTPLHNMIFLFLAALSSSFMGTTGASMLLLRPFLSLNKQRRHKTYLVVFFIFLVSNIGGSFSPIGDPPLFLGYLNGVDFFWVTRHLFGPMLCVMLPLLLIFYLIDRRHYQDKIPPSPHDEEVEKFRLYGAHNFIILGCILFTIILTGFIDIPRDILLLGLAVLSYMTTKKNVYYMNRFSWHPLREVALVFLAIFTTLIPIEGMLHSGGEGVFAPLLAYVNPNGMMDPLRYYFMTGLLSGFLDNAPTYLLFFHTAGGNPTALMHEHTSTLIAISLGAVFFGALTYIGNAPNLMVKSIAERANVRMPTFGGYLLWSFGILLPVLALFGWIYFG